MTTGRGPVAIGFLILAKFKTQSRVEIVGIYRAIYFTLELLLPHQDTNIVSVRAQICEYQGRYLGGNIWFLRKQNGLRPWYLG